MMYYLGLSLLLFFAPDVGKRVRRNKKAPTAICVGIKSFACLMAFAFVYAYPAWLVMAVKNKHEIPQSGPLAWREHEPGLATSIIDVTLQDVVVDRIHIVRIDPEQFTFRVHQSSSNPRTAETWRNQLQARVVINGSFYDQKKQPITPVKSFGNRFGPEQYTSTHGAFVSSEQFTGIIDLQGIDVNQALVPYPDVLVSYPLLFDTLGHVRAAGNDEWLANRSFLGIDDGGNVIMGMTERGFFSLRRLAQFLNESPLRLLCALNLDGGPVSSLAIQSGSYHHVLSGKWAIQDPDRGDIVLNQSMNNQSARLPIVLAVYKKVQSRQKQA